MNSTALSQGFGEGRIKEAVPMRDYTAFKAGGVADFFLSVDTIDDLIKAATTTKQIGIPFRVFGGGTNMLVADSGWQGLIIKNNCRKFDTLSMKGAIKNGKMDVEYALVYAEAGVITNQLVRYTIEQGLSGLEYALGLPGTIGGAIYMNANYPKRNIHVSESLHSAKILTKDGEVKEVDASYFQFSFNRSILHTSGDTLLSMVFKLFPMDKTVLWERGTEATTYRDETQPKGITTGMTFRNITTEEPLPEGKDPADLILEAGLAEKPTGGAMLSALNPRYIIDRGNATVTDVKNLLESIKHHMQQHYQVKLIMDVNEVSI
jgi:UDP-N-acetylmuramate dehydrogenase